MRFAAVHEEVVAASPEKVFDVITDKEHWSRLLPMKSSLAREGTTARQGVGAIHRLGPGLFAVEEEVLVYDRPSLFEYRVCSKAPIKHHHGTITFAPEGDGTRVRYTMELQPKGPLPSAAVNPLLRLMLKLLFKGLRREVTRGA